MAGSDPPTESLAPSPSEPWRPEANPWLIAVVVAMAAFMEVLCPRCRRLCTWELKAKITKEPDAARVA